MLGDLCKHSGGNLPTTVTLKKIMALGPGSDWIDEKVYAMPLLLPEPVSVNWADIFNDFS